MKTENEQIVEMLREQLKKEHAFVDQIVQISGKETGFRRTELTYDLVRALEKISRIEALIVRYQ